MAIDERLLSQLHVSILLACLGEEGVRADLLDDLPLAVDVGRHLEPIRVLGHHVYRTRDAIRRPQGYAQNARQVDAKARQDYDDDEEQG